MRAPERSEQYIFAVVVWVLLGGCYLLFAGQISLSEVIAGVPATTAAAAVALLLDRAQTRRLQLRAPWVHVVSRPLAALFPDAVRVASVLLHALWRRPDGPLGVVTRQPFRRGANEAGDAGRRGVVTLAASLAPNGYVLRVAEHQDALVLHRLVAVRPDPDREWPT